MFVLIHPCYLKKLQFLDMTTAGFVQLTPSRWLRYEVVDCVAP